jgi:hypothetical protein
VIAWQENQFGIRSNEPVHYLVIHVTESALVCIATPDQPKFDSLALACLNPPIVAHAIKRYQYTLLLIYIEGIALALLQRMLGQASYALLTFPSFYICSARDFKDENAK